jgi:hypothetical protein
MTERHSETIVLKEVEGSRRRYERVMLSGGFLVKKRRPSLLGFVRAERREETWWRTGVEVVSDLCGLLVGVLLLASFSVWMA